MMKLLGAALVMVASTGLGLQIAKDYRERPRQLRALMNSLRLLQAEIEYSVTPLPLALSHVAKRSQSSVAPVFETAAERLEAGNASVLVAFQDGMTVNRPKAAFKPEDYEVIDEFVKTLGTSDRVHQSRQLQVTLTRLEGLEREAREAQRKNERLWQYLGILSGLLVVILLY